MKTKVFEDLLRSEIKKAIKVANKATGFNDCTITAYFAEEEHPFDFDPEVTFMNVTCEICRNYEERVPIDVVLSIPMFDRRMTTARVVEW